MKRWQKILLRTVIVLLLVVLIGPFLIPVGRGGEVAERELADPDSKFIDVNGLSVHYKELGQGDTTFILLHGFGASVFSWREVMEPFAQYGRVLAYDRPAFGLTTRPMPGFFGNGLGTPNAYSVDGNVETLVALMDTLGVQKAILVGNSAGGGVAVAFALKYPQRVEKLILVDPALGGGGPLPGWLAPLLATPQMRHLGPLMVRNIAQTGNDTIRQAWHDPERVTDEIIDGYRKALKVYDWDKALYELTVAPRPADMYVRLGELKMPVLVIAGDDDRIVPTQYSINVSKQIPDAQLSIIKNCGHVPHEECPADFMAAVEAFLK